MLKPELAVALSTMAGTPRTPESMRIRVPVRAALAAVAARAIEQPAGRIPRVLVALSGGADSLALAAAVAAEVRGAGVSAGAVVVDHGLQEHSGAVAARAAEQARELGLAPVVLRRVDAATLRSGKADGPEAAARAARYRALVEVATETGAAAVLTAHTRDDQAEQVLLALARGSGTRSIAAIPPEREIGRGILALRPLLDEFANVTRETTEASCRELGLEPWQDPHNSDRSFARVRVRADVLPFLEQQLGSGFRAALARSADLAREDADALDALAEAQLGTVARFEDPGGEDHRALLSVDELLALSAAVRGRVIRLVAARAFDAQLTREHTLAIASLATAWKGQGPIHAPRILAYRKARTIIIRAR